MKRLLVLLFILFLLSNNSFSQIVNKRELRGVWIATVKNIDWPSNPDLTTVEKINEIKSIIQKHEELGINTIFFQVRTESDALYQNSQEPWSSYLTGQQGKAPYPLFDPLQVLIEEAHNRGIEVHAWFNLNRGTFSEKTIRSKNHITYKHPEWFIPFKGQYLYNFGLPEVRNYLTELILNIPQNYAIDGIHLDDYFYPYPQKGNEFPDYSTYSKYKKVNESLADWRRENINSIIFEISQGIQKINSKLKFGISPFGIWQHKKNDPMGSETTKGLESFSDLFADSRSWIQKGWIDYLVPQIYWATDHPVAPFKLMANWWDQNHFNRHIYLGMGIYHMQDLWSMNELKSQIEIADSLKNTYGKVLFSSHYLTNNYKNLGDYFKEEVFKEKALVPSMPWKDSIPPLAPSNLKLIKENDQLKLIWQKSHQAIDGDLPKFYAVYEFHKGEKDEKQFPPKIVKVLNKTEFILPKDSNKKGLRFYVTSLDQVENESIPSNEIEIN